MTDAEKLEALADWFDVYDERRNYTGPRDVQLDLRRIAKAIRGTTTPRPLFCAAAEQIAASRRD